MWRPYWVADAMMWAVEGRLIIGHLGNLGAALIGSDPETRQANCSNMPNMP
jgi:hypothetical protein